MRSSQELERRHAGDFEGINGGVYGYQTANELELFMKYGVPLNPDIVVILVMTHDMVQNTDWYEWTATGSCREDPLPVSTRAAGLSRVICPGRAGFENIATCSNLSARGYSQP